MANRSSEEELHSDLRTQSVFNPDGNIYEGSFEMTPLMHELIISSCDLVSGIHLCCVQSDGTASQWEVCSRDEVILRLLREGVDVHERSTSSGMTPLMLALEYRRSVQVVRKLMELGSDVNAVCNYGKTPLIYAIKNKYPVNLVSELIRKGADVNYHDSRGKIKSSSSVALTKLFSHLNFFSSGFMKRQLVEGMRPIFFAIDSDHDQKVVNELISNGVDVNCCCFTGLTPLMYAIKYNNSPALVGTLIKSVSDVNVKSLNGKNALIYAIKKNCDKNIINQLISKGADVNCSFDGKRLLLHALLWSTDSDIINTLIYSVSSVNVKCNNGRNALMYAINSHHDKNIIKALIHKGADVNHRCDRKMTPLMYAVHCNSNLDLIKILLNSVHDINAKCTFGKNALIYAIESRCDKNVVMELISKGADIHLKCRLGRNSLWYAVKCNADREIFTLLMNRRSEIIDECWYEYSTSPLRYAIQHNCDKIMVLKLIEKCPDINKYLRGPVSYPPLFCAVTVENINPDIITALINSGATFSHRNAYGGTKNVLMMIDCNNCPGDVYCKNKQVIDILSQSGVDFNETDQNGDTILHLTNCNYLMRLAVNNGLSIETKNPTGYTPLMKSVLCEDVEKMRSLLMLKANPNCTAYHSWTPLHHTLMDNEITIELLFYHGADLLAENDKGDTPLSYATKKVDQTVHRPHFKAIIKHFLLFYNENGAKDFSIFYKNDKIRKYVEKIIANYKNELGKMRRLLIKENLSFYDFCLLKKTFSTKFVRIPFNNYYYSLSQIKELFPLYRNVIVIRVKDNHRHQFYRVLRNYLEKIVVRPYDDSATELSFDSWYHISRYLSRKNLYNIFLASLEN